MPKNASPQEQEALSSTIKKSLRAQGFRIRGSAILPPKKLDKDRIRALHLPDVEHRRDRARDGLRAREDDLIKRFANGSEIDPRLVQPRLLEVLPDSEDELLFRFASLQWSIPVSSGYGRRLRFLVIDEQNEKLIGQMAHELTAKEKLDAQIELMKLAWTSFDRRRDFEWKVALGIWTALAAFIGIVLTGCGTDSR